MNQKRNTLKKVASVSAVVALAPSSWTKPIVSSVIFPAHAQTSTNDTPTFTQSIYETGITVTDASNAAQNILDLNSVTSDSNGDPLSFTIVSFTTPFDNGEITLFENVFQINSGILQAVDLFTGDPDLDGDISITVQVSDGVSSSVATVNLMFGNTM